jgi:excisionase family DNA binding protein
VGGGVTDPRADHAANEASLTREQVMKASEVAQLLRVPDSTVYDLARRGKLPGHKVGRAWRFIRPEVEAWLHAS